MGSSSPSRGAAAVLAATVMVLASVGALDARAQVLPIGGSTTTTTTTTAPPSSTSTTAAPTTSTTAAPTTSTTAPGRSLLPSTSSSSSTTSTTTSTTKTAPPATDQGPPPAFGGDGATPPSDASGEMPAELQAMVQSVRRSRPNSTVRLLQALAPLGQYGLDATQQAIVGFGRFPVAGAAHWSDDWWYPRFGPGWRLHEGIDIFAPFGTPVRAPVDGTVRLTDGGLGGLAVYVTGADRTYWYMAHLSGVAQGLLDGATVRTGQVVGYVGDSGNARGGSPHLHFEVHPKGGGPVPPKPIIDRFVQDALRLSAPGVLRAYAERAALRAAQPPPPELPPSISPRATLLWASSLSPAGGSVKLAELDALDAARAIDWSARRPSSDALAAREEARLWLLPLVPEPLRRALG